jgi:glutathione S-transferase
MLTLYYSPGACSMAPHIALEETGATYTPQLVSIPKGEHQAPEYLENVNPRGKVPALRMVPFEVSIAILNHIADSGLVLLNNCGHWPPFEKPAERAAQVLAFLRGSKNPISSTARRRAAREGGVMARSCQPWSSGLCSRSSTFWTAGRCRMRPLKAV